MISLFPVLPLKHLLVQKSFPLHKEETEILDLFCSEPHLQLVVGPPLEFAFFILVLLLLLEAPLQLLQSPFSSFFYSFGP